jgi:dihydroorotate dehydrogenase
MLAHDLAPIGLHLLAEFLPGLDEVSGGPAEFVWETLRFRHRLGIAGGVDKSGDSLVDWQNLGAAFLEVGTVTPRPQNPNSGRILARDWSGETLWNRMGFPSDGAQEVALNLARNREQLKVPLFVNLGKNRDTPNAMASEDYAEVAEALKTFADVFVVNVSSPNTMGLRSLQDDDALRAILTAVIEVQKASPQGSHSKKIPILIKLSPDLTSAQLRQLLETGMKFGASGFILTNTTLHRPPESPFPREGGLSGKALAILSESALHAAMDFKKTHGVQMLTVSSGGVLSPDDALKRVDMGADLVQLYSALVFRGPMLFRQWPQQMKDAREIYG